jgi:hypothetical protein
MPDRHPDQEADHDPHCDNETEPLKVTDRRTFTPSGDRRQADVSDGTASGSPEEQEAETLKGPDFELRREAPTPETGAPPEVEFNSFILSLASTAFIHLGELEDPVTHTQEINVPAARQLIDIIDMLHAKTRGNLEPKEEEFMQGILYELRMKYSEKASVK